MGNSPTGKPSEWIETAPEWVRWFAPEIDRDEELAAAFAAVELTLERWRTQYRASKAEAEQMRNDPARMTSLRHQAADLNRRSPTPRSEDSG